MSVYDWQVAMQSEHVALETLDQWADAGRLYAVVDPTDDPELSAYTQTLASDHVSSLFHDTERQEYTAVAPRMVVVSRSVLSWLCAHQRQHWGILLVSDVPYRDVREHAAEILFADLPDGKRYLFRFYDPRVLPAFLGTCVEQELAEFFGPLAGVITCSSDPQSRQEPRGLAFTLFSHRAVAPAPPADMRRSSPRLSPPDR